MAVSEMDHVESLPDFAPEDSIDLAKMARVLRAGARQIGLVTAVTLAVAIGIAFLLPVEYTSTTSFVPPSLGGSSSMASALAGQLASMGASDLTGGASRGSGDLYAGILRSRSIADELIGKNNLMKVYKVSKKSRAEDRLDNATKVVVDAKSTIVTVSVTDKSPARAQKLANDYMTALEEANGRLALSQASQRAVFFGKELEKEKDALEDAEVALKKTEEESGLIAPTGQTEAEIRTFADLQAQIAVRQVQLSALRQSATEENPEVIRLNSEIADLEGQLGRMQNGGGKSTPVAIPTSKVPALQLEYVRKQREVKYHEALFEMLSRQYEQARLDDERDPPVLQVLDEASWPDSMSSPHRGLIALGGLALGLIAGCIWVLWRERALHAASIGGVA